MIRRAVLVLCLSAGALCAQRAQRSGDVRVSVRIADSADVPVSGAEVAIVRGMSDNLARGTTDAAGRATLVVPRMAAILQLSVRRIGFQRGYRFFALAPDDTMSLVLRLSPTAVELAAVKVTADEDLKRKSYHLDADQIENSGRTFLDAADVFKLRPDMRNSRGGAKACEIPRTPRTGWIESVWVNGKRVTLAPVDPEYVHSRAVALGFALPQPRPNPTFSNRRVGPQTMTNAMSVDAHVDTVLSILKDIHAEHIAEVTYHDCFDMSVGKNNSDLAMFITLKPGIGFKPGIGTYVIPADTAHAAPFVLDSLARHRFRVLGVYDGESGDPVADVDVIDVRSGNRVRTTSTGTVSLFFLPEGSSDVQLRRAGYRDTTIVVRIAPADTTPITAVLSRKPKLR